MKSIWQTMNHAADDQALWLQLGIIIEFFTADVELYYEGKQEAELVWRGPKWVQRADFRIRFKKELVLTEELE